MSTSSSSDDRNDRRFRCRVPVTLLAGVGVAGNAANAPRTAGLELLTSDVSHRGMYVRSDSPPPLHATVSLRMALPPDNAELRAEGVVIHVLEPDLAFDQPPGFGVQLKTLTDDGQRVWNGFLGFVAANAQGESAPPIGFESFAPATAKDRIHRRHPRHPVELSVRLETLDALKTWVTDDISRGGAFIRTDLEIAPGSAARVHIVHPNTKEILSLDGVIARVERGVREGVAIQFTDITDDMRDALILFISPLLRGGARPSP